MSERDEDAMRKMASLDAAARASRLRRAGMDPGRIADLFGMPRSMVRTLPGHPQVTISHGGRTAQVDEGLADLLLALWRSGLHTEFSCQDFGPCDDPPLPAGWAYIKFADEQACDRFCDSLLVQPYRYGRGLFAAFPADQIGALTRYWQVEDAEVVAETWFPQHPDVWEPQSYTQTVQDGQEVLDAEVVYQEITTDEQGNLPLPSGPPINEAQVRIRPTGQECWWRLYSTPTSPMAAHQDHGVRAVYARRDNPHVLVMDLDGHGRHEVSALAWKVNTTDGARTGQTEIGEGKAQSPALPGPDSIDLLVAFPPTIPGKPRHWQQMTRSGQLKHPGDNRLNWAFYDGWWQGGRGVRFDDGDTWPPGDTGSYSHDLKRARLRVDIRRTDDDIRRAGFKDLGALGPQGVERDG